MAWGKTDLSFHCHNPNNKNVLAAFASVFTMSANCCFNDSNAAGSIVVLQRRIFVEIKTNFERQITSKLMFNNENIIRIQIWTYVCFLTNALLLNQLCASKFIERVLPEVFSRSFSSTTEKTDRKRRYRDYRKERIARSLMVTGLYHVFWNFFRLPHLKT